MTDARDGTFLTGRVMSEKNSENRVRVKLDAVVQEDGKGNAVAAKEDDFVETALEILPVQCVL